MFLWHVSVEAALVQAAKLLAARLQVAGCRAANCRVEGCQQGLRYRLQAAGLQAARVGLQAAGGPGQFAQSGGNALLLHF